MHALQQKNLLLGNRHISSISISDENTLVCQCRCPGITVYWWLALLPSWHALPQKAPSMIQNTLLRQGSQ